MRKHIALLVVVSCVLCLAATSANAALIVGQLGILGTFTPTGGTGLADATGIQVNPLVTSEGDMDLAPFSNLPGSSVTYSDFDFNPSSTPIEPLWTVTVGGQTLAFDLLSISVDLQTATQIVLSGTGILKLAGFENTQAAWNFTGNNSGGRFFFFSNDVYAPEPGSLLCFAGLGTVGLLGLVWGKRRKE